MSDRFESYETTLRNCLSESKTALSAKGVSVPEETKLRNVPALIGEIKTGSQVELVITAPDYEGMELTASKGEKHVNGTVTEGIAKIPVDEEGTWKVSAWDGNSIEIETDMTFEGELTGSKTYTVRIKKSEADPTNRVEYMDDAVGLQPITVENGVINYNGWDNRFILKSCYPVILNQDGTEYAKLNPNDYTKTINNQNSDITSLTSDRNAMVHIDKVYTRFWEDTTYEYLSITNAPKENYVAFGFTDANGEELDYSYFGMFLASEIEGKLRSMADQYVYFPSKDGVTSQYDVDISGELLKNGQNYNFSTFALYQVLNIMFIVMFKSEDSTKLGKGRQGAGEDDNTKKNAPTIKTGLLLNSGALGVDSSSGCVKFMHIEDFTSDRTNPLVEVLEGALIDDPPSVRNKNKVYVRIQKPYSNTMSKSNNSETKTYLNKDTFNQESGYIKTSVLSNEFGRIPSSIGATVNTYQVGKFKANYAGVFANDALGRSGGLSGLCTVEYFYPYNFYNGKQQVSRSDHLRPSVCCRVCYEPVNE